MLLLKESLTSLPSEPPFVVCAPSPTKDYFRLTDDGMQFTVRKSQPVDENGKIRTELRIKRAGTTSRLFQLDPPGSRRCTSIDLQIPTSWQKDAMKCLLFQWHAEVPPGSPSASTGNPPLSAFLWNDNFYLRLWTAKSEYRDLCKFIMPKGRWLRFQVELKWPKDGDWTGFVSAKMGGKELFPKYVGPMGYPEFPYIYSSVGLYWPGALDQTAVSAHTALYRRWLVGDTLGDVA